MKTHYLLINTLLLILFLGGCNSSGLVLPQGTGWPYEAVVVMNQKYWDNEVGAALQKNMGAPIPFLPRPEPAMKLTKIIPQHFDGILQYAKNIVIININASTYTKVSLNHEVNKWAQNQVVLKVSSPDEKMLIDFLQNQPDAIVDFFTKVEMKRALSVVEEKYSVPVMEKLEAKFGIRLNVPSDMTSFRDTTDFFWTSNNATSSRMDVVVYSFPYSDKNTFTVDYLINKRDSVLRENLPGAYPNSFMATELRAPIDYKAITFLGKYAGVTRGLWKMVGDMMGGPFVSLTRLDEKNNKVIVAEVFVYAPESDKRNVIRRGEASLYTLRLQDEFNISLDKSLDEKKSN
ncbi:DUF4837 family protein [Massilibacteroides sp.]|uniref:DUF4837 family protein n=1 Tax=Massilibacteroides sp. TaxID=2034766 RepID=UPI00260676F7|nr:DUF4837 family protein [Massilibacteroides sp.]MDD4514140.1 DUF4837 family protein [Massilibacteroides sp.]